MWFRGMDRIGQKQRMAGHPAADALGRSGGTLALGVNTGLMSRQQEAALPQGMFKVQDFWFLGPDCPPHLSILFICFVK